MNLQELRGPISGGFYLLQREPASITLRACSRPHRAHLLRPLPLPQTGGSESCPRATAARDSGPPSLPQMAHAILQMIQFYCKYLLK